ncbi:MAG: hypothetical protein ACYC49_02315 [Ignavibacteriaceae bacterium]
MRLNQSIKNHHCFFKPQSGDTSAADKQEKNIKAPEACLPAGRSDI